MNMRIAASIAMTGALVASNARADVKVQDKTQVKFEGFIGAMAGAFGGGKASEPSQGTVAVRGDRKLTLRPMSGELIDLKEEKVYRLDPRKQKYKVLTFAQIRKEMDEAREQLQKMPSSAPPPAAEGKESNVEVDFEVKETGQAKTINGFDAKESVLTVTVRQKGKTLEQGGGMVMRQAMWLAPGLASQKEIADFDRRYLQKLLGAPDAAAATAAIGQMAGLAMLNPSMGPALERMRAEADKLDGVPVLTTTTMETVKNPQQQAQPEPSGGGGLGALLARKMMKKDGGAQGPRSVLMTSSHEIMSVSAAVTDADVALPAGYTEN